MPDGSLSPPDLARGGRKYPADRRVDVGGPAAVNLSSRLIAC
jgi:hypothetical protein